MRAPSTERTRSQSGFTLFELLAFMLLIAAIFFGMAHGLRWGAQHGKWMSIVGGLTGALAGGVGFFAAVFLILSPFELYGAIKRSLEPADLVCTCQAVGRAIPECLNPRTALELEVVAESHHLGEMPELAGLRAAAAATEELLRDRMTHSPEFEERIALGAQLGDPTACAFGLAFQKPLLHYKCWAKLPKDLRATLRSGLPPRLCLFWALACAERALIAFEREFHQDKRPRIAFGAAMLLLRSGTPELLALCRPPTLTLWRASEAGCRVLHREFGSRFRGCRSKGERAVDALRTMARSAADFVEPSRLWAVYPPGDIAHGYETPEHRCAWSNPCFHAEDVAYEAALAADKLEEEFQWQREKLARMILAWERWDEDRQEWQRRVEQEWIPRVLKELRGVRFDVPAYTERLRNEWIPWNARQNVAAHGYD